MCTRIIFVSVIRMAENLPPTLPPPPPPPQPLPRKYKQQQQQNKTIKKRKTLAMNDQSDFVFHKLRSSDLSNLGRCSDCGK